MTEQQKIVQEERRRRRQEYREDARRRAEHEAHANMLRALGRDVTDRGEFVIDSRTFRRDRHERNHLMRLHIPRGAKVSPPVVSNGNHIIRWTRERTEISI